MLQVKDLVKTFGTMTAVDHVSFTVKPGEIMGLIGKMARVKPRLFE